jgi:hypothetical protein
MSDDPRAPKTVPKIVDKASAPGEGEDKSESEASVAEHDIVLVHGRTDDGQGIKALRSRPGRLEAAEIRPIKEGQPLHSGELVSMNEREGSPLLWDVEVLHRVQGEAGEAQNAGPPQVTSASYRRNWDEVFGATKKRGKKRRTPNKSTLN